MEAATRTTYRIVPERSQAWLDGKSSVHPIHAEVRGIEGSLDLETVDGQLVFATPPTLRFELPMDRLKSGNPLYDKETERRMETRRYPTIIAEAREIRGLGSGRFALTGDVTVRGVTRSVSGEVQLSAPDESTVVLEGEQQFDIRDFKIDPPRMLMVKVHPEITMRIKLTAEREKGA